MEVGPTKDVQRILECPVCTSVPLAPIFNCSKGHIICGKCRPLTRKCGLCESNFTDSRNYVLEKIVEASSIACEFRDEGCDLILRGNEFQQHIETCEFGHIRCIYGNLKNCNDSLLKMGDYLKHLQGVHNLKELPNRDGKFFHVYCLADLKNKVWCGTHVKFDRNDFFTRTLFRKDVFHFSLCIIGSEMDAAKYNVRMFFKRPDDDEKSSFFDITVPVITIKKAGKEILESMHCMLTKTMLKNSCQVKRLLEGGEKLIWQVNYNILRSKPTG
ncbi:unnamed protein product [Allacma fusca]|uniref:E3 ubiquitin-protein ligase Sina-like RING finger domain-containing protein n=1 Tax=Allacma fusca TaxID=39272 RepID=A0A8J2LSP5_9HEXA|nr:unnamed protein product [Allacma fusca]